MFVYRQRAIVDAETFLGRNSEVKSFSASNKVQQNGPQETALPKFLESESTSNAKAAVVWPFPAPWATAFRNQCPHQKQAKR